MPSVRDPQLSSILKAARIMVENYTGTFLIDSTLTVEIPPFRKEVQLPRLPVLEVLESDVEVQPDGYITGPTSEYITVQYRSFHESDLAKQAILQCAAALYESPTDRGGDAWKVTAQSFSARSYVR